MTPFATCAVAGSTNTGSIDDVPALADLAEEEGLWLHVDAAYGAAARLAPREGLPGLERADSLTVDPHKWLFQPYDLGGLLVTARGSPPPSTANQYYAVWGPEEQPLHWYQYSLEGALPVPGALLWLSWKHLGSHGFAQLIERNVDLARHLARRARDLGFEVIEPELAGVPAARPARRGPGRMSPRRGTAGARGLGDRLALDDDAAWPNVAPCRGDQLSVDRRGRRPRDRHPRGRVRRHPRRARRLNALPERPRFRVRTGSPAAGTGGLEERLGQRPELRLFAPRDRLVADPERAAASGLHLAEDEHSSPLHDQIQLADPAAPVARHDPKAATAVRIDGRILALGPMDPSPRRR